MRNYVCCISLFFCYKHIFDRHLRYLRGALKDQKAVKYAICFTTYSSKRIQQQNSAAVILCPRFNDGCFKDSSLR